MATPNSTMDWDKLKVFHAAAEAGSFTHAGERLGLSQSAVSRQVSALEAELAVSLFHRHARGLILTEQGELLYRTAHEVFMKLEAARTKLTDSRERPNGELKVQTTPGISGSLSGYPHHADHLGRGTGPGDARSRCRHPAEAADAT
jgi:DNA-binding transcriptional LysR family regulator